MPTRRLRLLAVASLLAAGLALQLHFFRTFPQPPIFGDPRGYYEVGQRLLQAVRGVEGGGSVAQAFDSVRGAFFLLGVGSVFAVLDALRPGDLAFFRDVMAVFNTLAMLGAFLLGRSLARSFAGGLLALTLAASYPTFALQTGRLYPDPITGGLFVWAAWLFLEGTRRGRARWLVGSGLALTGAALVRSQLALFLILLLGLALAASAPFWARRREGRRLALAFTLASVLPLTLAWAGIAWAVGDRDDVIRYGNLTFRPGYPMGYWLFLDTDGWSSAYPFKAEPFYQAMLAENQRRPGLFHSRPREAAFVARWLLAHPRPALLVPLHNAYRLYDRPANDYKWDYPCSYGVQVWAHRAIVVLAAAGLALFLSESAAAAGVFLIPLSLLALHGLMFTWPRYNVPTMPIVIAAAGAALARLAASPRTGPALRARPVWSMAAAAAVAGALGALLADGAPGLARALSVLAVLAVLALPLAVVRRVSEGARAGRLALAAWVGLALLVLAHVAQDREWHAREVVLGGEVAEVRQEIALDAGALARLRAAPEAFVVFDLSVPRGDTNGLSVRIGSRGRPGDALVSTMPRLPESTSTGGRDARGYRQWWALRLDPADLPAGPSVVSIALRAERAGEVRLRLDRFGAQERVYEGPSFGERPRLVPLKLEYDGDYRMAAVYPLASAGTRTTIVGPDGVARPQRAVARIRLVTLERDQGGTTWEGEGTRAPRAAWALFAYAGTRGTAGLQAGGRPVLDLPLDRTGDYTLESGPFRLCHVDLGRRGENPYGAFVLEGPGTDGSALALTARFLTGMSERPMFFMVDARRPAADLAPYFDRCGVAPGLPRLRGAVTVLDASRNAYPADTGRWTVSGVF